MVCLRIRDRLGISETTQRRLTRLMQVFLVGILVFGVYRRDASIAANGAIALGVTFLPALLERDYGIPMDAGLTLWITTAIFLHAVGGLGPYRTVWWWDHVTHTLSASVVGGAGYATTRALDIHSDEVEIPPRFMFVFILLFVLSFGVLWEVLEFGIAEASALIGTEPVLTQYGLEDTMKDLLFDTVGAVIVAVWGTAHLTDVVGGITRVLDSRVRG